MSSDRYQIVRYEPKFKQEVLALQEFLWGPALPMNASYFDWKYEQNPYARTPHIYLALFDGRVVGMRGLYGGHWRAGPSAETLNALAAGDLVIVPEHRGHGLFTRIMEYALQDAARSGVSYLLNFSAGVATRLGSLTMGWRSVGSLRAMVRPELPPPRRWRQGEPQPVTKTPEQQGQPFELLDQYQGRRGAGVLSRVSVSSMARPEAMAELVRRNGNDGRIQHVRDAAYFAWRFMNPRSTYRFIFLGRWRLEAYLVLQARVYLKYRPPIRIVDWNGTTPKARAAVLVAALQRGYFGPLEIWAGTLGAADLATLTGLGFVQARIRSVTESFATVLVRPVQEPPPERPWLFAGRDLLNLASWDLRLLDSDSC